MAGTQYWLYRDTVDGVGCRRVQKGRGIVKSSEFKEYIGGLKKLGNDVEVYDIRLKKIAGLDGFYCEWGGCLAPATMTSCSR